MTDLQALAGRPMPRRWHSRAILLIVLPAAGVYAAIQVLDLPFFRLAESSALFAVALAALVFTARAATPGAALLGALLAFCYGITPSFPHSSLWPLAATLALTLGASRLAKSRLAGKAHPHSRDAAQVAANLGAGALAGATLNSHGALAAHTAMLAALAELAADTLASELGQFSSRPPRMLLTGRIAAPGTDGAISLAGTAFGLLGAALVCTVGWWAFALPLPLIALALACGFAGMFIDSLLGQLLETSGILNNDAVNFLSNLAAVLAALWISVRIRA